jgi:hypothetical protein
MSQPAMKSVIASPKLVDHTGLTAGAALGRADLINLGLIGAAFVLFLLVIPPVRPFPNNDDWAYAQQVEPLLRWEFTRYPWTQPYALSHVALGALFTLLLGPGYTSLTIATLATALLCLVSFYLLLRELGATALAALFGTAVLGFNPVFASLSYTFMTDVSFLGFAILACLLYVRAIKRRSEALLWAGSVAGTLALLTRQFGAFIFLAVLACMWAAGWLSWRRAIAACLVPAVAMGAYLLWESGQPSPLVELTLARESARRQHSLPADILERITARARAAMITGLLLVPILRVPKRPRVAILLTAIILALLVSYFMVVGSLFPNFGNVLNRNGLTGCCPTIAPVWNEAVWTTLGIAGGVSIAVLLAATTDAWESRPKFSALRRALSDPAWVVYGFGLLSALALLPPFYNVFDRYLLLVVPALILMVVRSWSSIGWARWAAVAVLALFTVAAHHDDMEHRFARWEVAEALAASGVPRNHIDAGYEWEGEYLYGPATERIIRSGDYTNIAFPIPGLVDPEYVVSDFPLDGYRETGRRTFTAWLEGGIERPVLVLKRE